MKKILLVIVMISSGLSFALEENRKREDSKNSALLLTLSEEQKFINDLNEGDPKEIHSLINQKFNNDSALIKEFIEKNELYDLIDKADNVEER
jgi:hypothetical protein